MTTEKYKTIVNEWFARLDKGYAHPPYTNHEMKILDEITQKHNLHKVHTLNEAAANFATVLENEFKNAGYDSIPAVVGTYNVGRGKLVLAEGDKDPFTTLFKLKPSSDVGYGEVSLFWLFNYKDPKNPSQTAVESHGKSSADLQIQGMGCEIKAYESHNQLIKLGVFESSHEMRKRLNSLFGIVNLTSAISGTKNYFSELAFKFDDLVAAFESVLQAKSVFSNDEIRQLLNVNSPSSIFNKFVNELDTVTSGDQTDPEILARDFMAEFIASRINLKFGGREGYLINCLPSDPTNIWMFEIPADAEAFLKTVDPQRFSKMTSVQTANLKMNYNIFN